MKRTLKEAALAVSGTLVGEDRQYGAVSTDSRTLAAGSLFVALKGPTFDGGKFVAAAAQRGAVGALVEQAVPGAAIGQIVVPDTLGALQQLGAAWRAAFSIPIVGVGGSNGKTTAKEMTSAILSRLGPCMATHGNLNNHIGVPVTLMRLEPSHRSAVVEMGANRIGDVAELVRLSRPTVGFITNAGAEHLEGFGDLEGVARGEGEMVAGLDAGSTAIINADDAFADYWRGVASASRAVTFGRAHSADFTALDAVQSIERGEFATRFTLRCPLGERAILLKAGGAHNISNALGAAAAAAAAGGTAGRAVCTAGGGLAATTDWAQAEIASARVKTLGKSGLQSGSPRLVMPISTGLPAPSAATSGPPLSPWQLATARLGASRAQSASAGSKGTPSMYSSLAQKACP